MLKNCVFRPDVDTVAWIKAAGIRAVKTMAQTFVATIGTAAVMGGCQLADGRQCNCTVRHSVCSDIYRRHPRGCSSVRR